LKILLIGASGQLGTDLHRVLVSHGATVAPVSHAELEVSDGKAVDSTVAGTHPTAVISTGAFHKVEECEKQAARAFEVNALGARNLAQACDRAGCVLVHFSTDYVFDGMQRSPYSEDDLPCPINVYGASKLAGEHLIRAVFERYYIVRTCGLYGWAGSSGKGGNFVETMRRKAREGAPIKVVDDQVLTPTFTVDLAEAVVKLLATEQFGLYHITSEGECSWYKFAKTIFELEKTAADLAPATTAEVMSPVRRPAYSVLNKSKLGSLGICMPAWEDALARYLESRSRQHAADAAGRV